MGINIGTTGVDEIFVGEGNLVNDYSAMRGPAPSGYHVPSKDEWVAVRDIWTALGGGSTDGTNFGIALKLPFAGLRSYSSASVNYQGRYGHYWSSSRYDSNNAYRLYIGSSTLSPQSSYFRACGFSVRCFKDTSTIPTSSWTKLYGTSIESGGIFWSSADGLISLSSDGNTWYTIADKNLGATTVWNSGDTLSEANCGKYFQWGNNYGFAWTGSITTSSTQVDASNYGPGNYYSSSTFITRSSSPYRRDTTNNGDLRGGITGVQQKQVGNVTEVYVGTTKIRPATPAEFTDWDAGVISSVTAELGQDIDSTILHLFGDEFYVSLDDDIGNGDSLYELGRIYNTIANDNGDWYGLQISDGGDMTDINHIRPYGNLATDAVCIVWDNDDWSDAQYLVGTPNGLHSFRFQFSSLASHFSGKDTVCMFIFLV